MAINRIQGRKVIAHVRTEDTTGVRIDAGPHIGIVKHVFDGTLTGRLQVYIPFLGGDPENRDHQKIVQYASPFAGYTNLQSNPNEKSNETTSFETVRHSYGMWFTPPDVGVRVLVTFANGNPNNGFWFACIPNTKEHNQMGSSGGVSTTALVTDPQVKSLISGYSASYVPGVEVNGAKAQMDFVAINLAPHRVQTKILAEQGLLADTDRGIDGATSQRESPSGAFGITTPGRTYADQVTDDLLQRTTERPVAKTADIREKVKHGRKGGHQFIMDDGDADGNQRRVKLRSAAGHQLIMDDTTGMVYVSNSTGTNWIELTNDGQMLIYSASDITVRTGGDFNVKVDGNLNTEVNGNYNLKVRGNIKTEVANREDIITGTYGIGVTGKYSLNSAEGDVSIKASNAIGLTAGLAINLESGAASGWKTSGALLLDGDTIGLKSGAPGTPATPAVPTAFTLVDIKDTTKTGDIWKHEKASNSTAQSIMPKITTHEPYNSRVIRPLVSTTGKASRGPEPQG